MFVHSGGQRQTTPTAPPADITLQTRTCGELRCVRAALVPPVHPGQLHAQLARRLKLVHQLLLASLQGQAHPGVSGTGLERPRNALTLQKPWVLHASTQLASCTGSLDFPRVSIGYRIKLHMSE